MERMASIAPLPISPPPANAIDLRSELDVLMSRMSDLLALDENQTLGETADSESEVALRLALIAMTEAEKRIERQEQRILELESLSITDELTNLLNRRGFSMQLHRALAFAARGKTGGSIIMIDLDRFKRVNDTYGHAAGDALLQAVAESLKHRVRETDAIGRLGGDEFAVLMPGISREIAAVRIRGLDKELNDRSLQWEGIQIPIGASLGLAHYGEDDDELTVLRRADEDMYRAKFERRDNQKAN
jgi:diguanylate cyclase (GGDEF)-like protein